MKLAARALLGVLVTAAMCAGGEAHAQFSESEVKAAFIFNIAKYVEWSAASLPEGKNLRVCFLAADASPGELAEALARHAGKSIRGHALEVLDGTRIDSLRPCHVAVVDARTADRERILGEERDILTVSDSQDFIDQGGMIGLVIAESRVGFEANLASARRAGIRLPAQLLKLARRIRE